MIKVLTISGSPVEGSSTDFLLRHLGGEITKNIGDVDSVTVEFVKLNDLQFIPCQSCGDAPTPEFCFYDDDLSYVYKHLADADCVLLGSPIYFDSVSAQAKLFIDRCNCVRPVDWDNIDPDHEFLKLLPHKRPGAMVLVGGEQGWFEGARRVMAGFFKWIEVTNEGVLVHHAFGYEPESAKEDAAVLKEAATLGRKLARKILGNR